MLASYYYAIPIQTGRVVSYAGMAVINGETKFTIRGPHFDTLYELSNIYKFDIEVKQNYDIGKFHRGILTGDIDFAFPFPSSRFTSYQMFQAGRFAYFLDATIHVMCLPPVQQVSGTIFMFSEH